MKAGIIHKYLPIGKSAFLASAIVAFALISVRGVAQQNQPGTKDYEATSLQWILANPPLPEPRQDISAQRLDNPGPCPYHYWVVAQFRIGAAQPGGPASILNGACTLVNGNQVSWAPVLGATSYDLLRTSTPGAPTGACNCAVTTGNTSLTATDTGTLSSYTVSTFVNNINFLSQNQQCSSNLAALIFAPNGTPAFTITSDSVLHQGNCTGPVITGGGLTFPLLAPNGSATVPEYSFAAHSTSGLFWDPSIGFSGGLAWTLNGTRAMGLTLQPTPFLLIDSITTNTAFANLTLSSGATIALNSSLVTLGGAIQGQNQVAGSPTYSFLAHTGTGMYYAPTLGGGNSGLGFAANGSIQAGIDTNGEIHVVAGIEDNVGNGGTINVQNLLFNGSTNSISGTANPSGLLGTPVDRWATITDNVLATNTRTITASTTEANDFTVLCNATGGAVTLTLSGSPILGTLLDFKKTDATTNDCVLSGNGNNIDGAGSLTFTAQYQAVLIQWDGTQWDILASMGYSSDGETILGELQVETGVASAPGIQHTSVNSCTTSAALNSACNTTLTWPTAWNDAGFTLVCTLANSIAGGAVSITGVVNNGSPFTTSTVTIQNIGLNAAASQWGINCIGMH